MYIRVGIFVFGRSSNPHSILSRRSLDMENIPPSDGAAGQPASRATKRKASGDLPNDSASRELMPVYLRVRPTEDDDWYIKVVNETEVEVSSGGTVERGRAKYSKSEKFTFSRIFPHTTSQQELYDGVVGPMVDQMFMPGEASSLLLAYGASSSGKTFTTRGTTQNPGVLIRAIDNILGRVGTSSTKLGIKPRRWNEFQTNTGTMPKRISTVSDRDCRYEYAVFLSFAEIYIEQVYDLFQSPVEPSNQDMVFRKGPDAASKRPIAQLKEDTEGRKYINGQIEVRVRDMAEVHNLVESVMQNRSVLSTRMNEASSRSHLFSVVKLLKIPIVDGRSKMEGTEVSRIAVVDLAGAERIVQSGVEGKAHRETKNINKSLHTLAMCVEAMRDNQGKSSVKRGVIPWRESKLTLLLHPYFEFGQARFVVNVHPSMQHSRVTSEVFRFAQRAGALQATAIRKLV
ncbi:P-loop containing nucleoside triphosphate hydrolase protein [Phlyctochytrium arcticum]|nr:P-loop containing nucleoside triphosphate hydrolase protein [Phlyctochytrium arcticum]